MIRLLAFAVASLAWVMPVAAAEIDVRAEEIVAKANRAARYAADDGRSQARMLIVDAQGRTQQRQFAILRRDRQDGGEQDFLVVFSHPADVRGTVLLVNKKIERDDDRWLYLPALDLDKRISAGDKRTSFVGSDFFYEDISGRNPALDWHRLLSETPEQAVVECRPKDPSDVEFAYSHATIDTRTWLPIKAEYFNEDGRLIREIVTLESREIQGFPTVLRSEVRDHRSGTRTVLEMRDPRFDIGLGDEAFLPAALRNPPRQWLRP